MIELAVALLAGSAVWIVIGRSPLVRDAVVLEKVRALAPTSPTRRLRLRGILDHLGRRLPGDRAKVRALLDSAGFDAASPDTFIALRWVLAVAGGFIGLRLGPSSFIFAPLLGWAGFFSPEQFMKRRAGNRADDLERDLPDAVDLLVVCAQAGLNVSLSLARVGERMRGPLGEELRKTRRHVDLGMPRAEALQELAARTRVEELEALSDILANAERFGTQVSSALGELARQIRGDRRRRAEEQARRAPVKMLFPLVFLILPGFVLLTLVPLLMGTFRSLGF